MLIIVPVSIIKINTMLYKFYSVSIRESGRIGFKNFTKILQISCFF